MPIPRQIVRGYTGIDEMPLGLSFESLHNLRFISKLRLGLPDVLYQYLSASRSCIDMDRLGVSRWKRRRVIPVMEAWSTACGGGGGGV